MDLTILWDQILGAKSLLELPLRPELDSEEL
jgi:hypothetical protein